MDLLDILPRLVGAFYLVGGWFALRAATMGDILDRVLAALDPSEPLGRKDVVRRWVLGTGAVLTSVSGAALLLMSEWAIPLFLANLLVQAGWLAWARTAFPPEDEAEAQGRRSVINAAVGYTGITALVFWLDWRDRLSPMSEPVTAAILGVVALGLGGWMIKSLSWNPPSLPDWSDLPPIEDTEIVHPARLRLAPVVGDWTLWDADDGRGLDPFLYLPRELAERIVLWESACALDAEDPFGPPRFATPEAELAHRKEGEAIVVELELIYGFGVVEGPVYPV